MGWATHLNQEKAHFIMGTVIDRLAEKYDTTKRMAKIAWYLRKYVKGKKTRRDMITFEGNQMRLAGGYDAIPFPSHSWGHVIKAMMDLHGPAAVAGIKEGYRNVGAVDAERASAILDNADLGQLLQLWVDLGYTNVVDVKVERDGEMQASELTAVGTDLEAKPACWEATVTDNFSVRALDEIGADADYPMCIFGPYYTAGFLETWFDVFCTFTETACQGMGDEYCKWLFEFDWTENV